MAKSTQPSLSRYAISSRYMAALLGGTLLPLAYAPWSWWPVAIICCSALYWALRDAGLRQTLIICLLFGTGLYATGASWIYVSIHQYGQAPMPLAALLTGLFALGLGAVFTLSMILYTCIKLQKPLPRILAFTALWVLGEWFRGWFLTGFPWLYLGYGFIDTWLAGWAPVAGVLAISGIVAFTGALLIEAVTKPSCHWLAKPSSNSKPLVTSGAFLMLASLWLGGWLLQQKSWTQALSESSLNVNLVQANNPVLSKWGEDVLPSILSEVRNKTLSFANSDVIIWPESAIPALQFSVQDFLSELDSTAAQQQTALILGIPGYSNGQYFNSVIGLGTAKGSYQKRRLVPFGEYVPFEQWLRGLINFFDLPMSAFTVGADEQALISIGPYKIATAVCYEIAYSWPLAKDARQANLLLTVSNDTWFGDSLGPHQHLQIARIRALETGKPLMRVTNDGITAFIDAQGQVIKRLPRFGTGVLQGQVVPHKGMTPYSRWGEAPVISLCFIIFLIAAVLSGRRAKNNSLNVQ